MLGKLNDKYHIIFFTNTVFNAALLCTTSVLQFLLLPQMKNAKYVDGFTVNTSVKVTWNSQQMNETNITTYTPWNITDCDSYSYYIVHDALTFIGEHNMHRVVSST